MSPGDAWVGPSINIDMREQSPVGQGTGVRLGVVDGEADVVGLTTGPVVGEAAGDSELDGEALGVISSSWEQATSRIAGPISSSAKKRNTVCILLTVASDVFPQRLLSLYSGAVGSSTGFRANFANLLFH
jgi:hypothetical protein